MKPIPLDQAVAMVPDGATVMVGGFMGVGTPERVIDELVRQRKRDLTVIANDTATPAVGIGKLIGAKLVKRAIVSHIGPPVLTPNRTGILPFRQPRFMPGIKDSDKYRWALALRGLAAEPKPTSGRPNAA